ncbi:hypothetical protein GOD93_25550 [Sinorhizobium medicae]|nr:hypothetical protein [Sinorhizobium medicae]
MTSGNGQAWDAKRPQGFWRTFAELDLDRREDVLMFLARYGDPNGALPKRSSLERWREMQGRLKVAALAYEPPEAGISHVSKDDARVKHAASLGIPGEGVLQFPAVFEPGKSGSVPRVLDLGTFMQMSAVMMIFNRMPTRRCDECGHWYAHETARGFYCSTACKSASHRRKHKEVA